MSYWLIFTLLGVEVFLTDSNVHRVLNSSMNVVEYFGNVKYGLWGVIFEFKEEKQSNRGSLWQCTLIQLPLCPGEVLVAFLSGIEQLHNLSSPWALVQQDGCISKHSKARYVTKGCTCSSKDEFQFNYKPAVKEFPFVGKILKETKKWMKGAQFPSVI